MRRTLLTGFLAVLTACGSSIPTDGTPPPPPPSSTPASVAVMAGDGQQAEPGALVSLSPSVVVKDASGALVSGAAVTFGVDSGGGTVTGAVVTTGSNGVAAVGSWTLGTAEGRNILKATVGALAPLRIVATAKVVGASFPATTIGTGGGSITISQAGPLNGFKLDVPGGAFTASMTATVSYASNASIPRTPTMNPVSPLITISTTTTDFAKSPLTIHISAPTPANTFPVIMVYDQASGATEVLSTISWDANGVTALMTTLNGSTILAGNGGSLRGGGAALRSGGVGLVDVAIPMDVLMRDYDSGFRPGVDDWEFPSIQTELIHTATDYNSIGGSVTALWYYSARPSPTHLNGRFQLQAGVPLSDRAGMRWSAIIGAAYDRTVTNELGAAFSRRASPDASFDASFDRNQFLNLRTKFAHAAENGGKPQPQLLEGFTALVDDDHELQYLIAYRVSGDQVFVADPHAPGDVNRSITFADGQVMTPYTSGQAALVTAMAVGISSVMSLDQVAALYPQVVDGTVGQNLFPTHELRGWDGHLYDTLFVVDTLRFWFQCANCKYGFATSLSPAPSANIMTGSLYNVGLDPVLKLGSFPLGGFLASTAPDAGTDLKTGLVVESALFAGETLPGPVLWLDWHPFTIRKLLTSITPAAPTGAVNVPLALTHQVNLALLPSSVTYRWDFGDKTAKVSVHNVNTVNHTYTAAGTYPATAEILDDRNNQVIGRSTTTVTVVAAVIDLTVAGNWPNNSAPALGSYHYSDLHGSRAANAAAGIDALLIDFDPYTPDNVLFNFGITFVVVVPTGSELHAGQTFTKWVSGPTSAGVGQFNLALAGDLAHPENGTVLGGNFGTFTITAVYPLSDGSTALSFTFSVSNGVGGTITGSGVWGYR